MCDTPHGLKIMSLFGRFEILSSPLGRQGGKCLDQISLKYGTPVALCVLCGYNKTKRANERTVFAKVGREIPIYVMHEVYPSLHICVQVHLGTTAMGYFSCSKPIHRFAE